MMDVTVLGPIRVTGRAGDVAIGAKERTVLAVLVAQVGQVVGYDELIDALWPEDPPRTARRTLQAYVARLRSSLEAASDLRDLVSTQGRGYRLALDRERIDAHRFVRMAELGRRALEDGRPAAARDTLREALAMWRGPAYSGVDSPNPQGEARRLEQLRRSALEDLLTARTALGDGLPAVAADLEAHVSEDPLREHAWALLATAYAAQGDQARALRAIERARSVLAEELGVDPGPELQSLHARILAQDPGLLAAPARSELPPTLAPAATLLVGRRAELAALQEHWRRAATGSGTRVLLTGEPGRGRWRLACTLAAWVHDEEGSVVLGADAAPAPLLRVLDLRVLDQRTGGVELPDPADGELQLVVAEASDPDSLPRAEASIHLGPLSPTDVRELLTQYAPADVHPDVLDDAAWRVLVSSGGSAERIHDEALQWTRDLLAGRVARSADRNEVAGARLDAERAALARDVQHLQQLRQPEVIDRDGCPWPGLASYTQEDAAWFAGRDRLTAHLLARLGAGQALLLVGPSGSGKTSLLHAGMLPALAAGALPASAGWRRIVIRPGAHPMHQLLTALVETDDAHTADPGVRARHDGGARPRSTRTLLVIDQMEECWTACTDPQERAAFLAAVVDLIHGEERPMTLVAAVRADQAGSIAGHPGLAEALAGRVVFVGPMSEPELRRAITVPASRASLLLDDGLAEALVEDTLRQPGGLPLLSAALADLWAHRSGRRLLLAQYLATGGVGSAVARMADRALADLDLPHQQAARVLFTRLAGPGEGDHVTRRRVPLSELDSLADPRVRECVDPLARARLLTVSEGEVEVAHEALFRAWPRLREWLADDATSRDLLRRVGRAAAEWDAEGREPTALWAGARLTSAADLLAARPEDFTTQEAAFVQESIARVEQQTRQALDQVHVARRQNQRLRVLLGAVATTLAVAVVAGALAVRSGEEARARSVTATAQRLAATALTETNLAQQMLTAVESVRTEESPQTRGALLSVLESSSAVLARIGAGTQVVDMDVAPGSTTAYVATESEDVLAVDMVSGARRVLWSKPNAEFSAIRVSPDERLVALTALVDGGPRTLVVDTTTGRQIWEVPFYATHEAGFVFTGPDEIALAGRAALVRFRVGEALPFSRIPWPDTAVLQKARMVRVDDRRVLLLRGSAGAAARLVDLATGTVTVMPRVWSAAAVSPDGRLLVTQGSFPGDVEVLDLDKPNGPAPGTIPYRDLLLSATFLPDDRGVVLGGAQGEIVVASTSGATRQRALGHHSAPVTGLSVAPDGWTLWSAGTDGDLLAWDLSGSRGLRRTRGNGAPGLRGSLSADGRTAGIWAPVASGASRPGEHTGSALAMDMVRGSLLAGPLPAAGAKACDASLSPDGRTLLVLSVESPPTEAYTPGTAASTLVLYDLPSGRLRAEVPLPHAACGVTVTPDSSTALLNGEDGVTEVDVDSAELGRSATLPSIYLQHAPISVSPDGGWVATARADEVVVLSRADLSTVASWPVDRTDTVTDFAWVQGSATLVEAGGSGRVLFRAIPEGRLLGGDEVHSPGAIVDLATSADGGALASLAANGDLVLWDPAARRVVGTPLAAPAEVGSLPHSPEVRAGGYTALLDEGRLGWVRFGSDSTGEFVEVLYASGGLAVRYPMDTADLIARACALAGREPTAEEWSAMHPGAPQRPTCGTYAGSLLGPPAAS
jgi:DNA-binding SARP family transcriptional activator/WD40 repeat protein